MEYIIYFLVGVIQDIILTLNWRYISENRATASAISAFMSAFISLIVLYNIITTLTNGRNFLAIIVYASGIGVGTYIAIRSEKLVNKFTTRKKRFF